MKDERPLPPWHPVPLVELLVLAGIVLMVWGFVHGLDDGRGRVLLVTGLGLGSLGGLDTAAREHFGGHTSHTIVLAALPAVVAAGALYFAGAPWIVLVVAAIAIFAAAFAALRRAWRRATL